MIIPSIIERWNQGAVVGYDIFSRLLPSPIFLLLRIFPYFFLPLNPLLFITRPNCIFAAVNNNKNTGFII